jgi:hypothetical protein
LRGIFWLSALAVLIWFSATVPLGNRTLLGHLRAISSTPEARDLASGTEEEARRVAERIREEWSRDAGTATSPPIDHRARSPQRHPTRERTGRQQQQPPEGR